MNNRSILLSLSLLFVIIFLTPIYAQNSILDRSTLNRSGQSVMEQNNRDILPPHKAFIPTLHYDDKNNTLTIIWDVNRDYYLYKNKIHLSILNEGVEIGDVNLPKGIDHHDEYFGSQEIYDAPFASTFTVTGDLQSVNYLHLNLSAQGCAKSGFCFAPHEWELKTEINPNIKSDLLKNKESTDSIVEELPPVSEHDRLTQILLENQFLALPLFFILGLFLTFTPCVLPMLPILSGILTSQSRGKPLTTREGFKVSLIYVLSMALVYTLLGVLAAHAGQGLTVYMQNPYVLTGFAIIFVLLALSMFDVYQLQMPSAIQTRLNALSNRQQEKQSYIGVVIMGMLSALIVGPCVTAPLIGIITLIAQTQNYFLGASALFSMSIGMGVPLLILGASSGHLLPKAGGWMNQVKTLFGFMLLGLAAYFFGRTLNHFWEQLLYAVIALSTFIWLIVHMAGEKMGRLFFGAIALAVLMFGIHAMNESKRPIDIPYFNQIKGIKELNIALSESQTPIALLEFNADWCVSCKEMEKHVFSQTDVKEALKPITLLSTDVTKNDNQDKALLKHFTLYGPPALLFFNDKGEEIPQYRIIGSISKQEFIERIEYILRQHP